MKAKITLSLPRLLAVSLLLLLGTTSSLAEVQTYPIYIDTPTNGSVVSDVNEASVGQTVTLTVTPDNDYEIESINVTAGYYVPGGSGGGRSPKKLRGGETTIFITQDIIPVTQCNATEYNFTLPESFSNPLSPTYNDNTTILVQVTFTKIILPEIIIDDSSTEDYDYTQSGLANAIVRRTFKSGVNTLVLPFAVSQEELEAVFGEDVKIYTICGVKNGNSIILEVISDGIKANEPCLLRATLPDDFGSEISFESRTFVDTWTAYPKTRALSVDLVGSYKSELVLECDNNYVISNNKFYRVSNNHPTMKATRAYIHIIDSTPIEDSPEEDVKELNLIFPEDNATSLESLSSDIATHSGIFTLDGRRVMKPSKGMYIIDGKKVIIK